MPTSRTLAESPQQVTPTLAGGTGTWPSQSETPLKLPGRSLPERRWTWATRKACWLICLMRLILVMGSDHQQCLADKYRRHRSSWAAFVEGMLAFFILFFKRQKNRQKQTETSSGSLSKCLQRRSWSWELGAESRSPWWWQGPSHLSHHLLPPSMHMGRKLGLGARVRNEAHRFR